MDSERRFAADLGARWHSAFAAVLAVTGAFLTLTLTDTYAGRAGRDRLVAGAAVILLWAAAMAWASWAAHDDRSLQPDPNLASWQVATALTLLTMAGIAGVMPVVWKSGMAMAAFQALAGLLLAHRVMQPPLAPNDPVPTPAPDT